MDLLAEFVDAAVGEHRAAQQRVGLLEIQVEAVLPRQDAVVPVAAGVGGVAVLLGHRDERELVPVVGIAQARLRRDRHAVGAGGPRPHRLAVRHDQRHLRADYRRRGVEARHEHERILRTVLDRDAEVGDLHQARARNRLVVLRPRRPGPVNRRALLDRRPDEPGARGFQHAGQIEAVRLDAVGRDAEAAGRRRRRRRDPEVRVLQLQQRRHQLLRVDGRHPLRDRRKVARVERQQRAATLFPHAVAVAEAGERALVPVLDLAGPRVAERLAVGRLQVRGQRREKRRRRRLRLEARVFEAEVFRLVPLPALPRPRLRLRHRLLAASAGDVVHLQ